MADFVYTTVAGKIPSLLDKLRQVGVPPKATVQWLKSIGFKSSNDASLLGVLKQVGLTDANGVPTSRWAQYRGRNHKEVLGAAIRDGYAELFAVYPDAWQRSQTDLEHVFSTSSTGGKQVIAKTVATFKNLAAAAEFSDSPEQVDLSVGDAPLHKPVAAKVPPVGGAAQPLPNVHIDIQVHISPEASPVQIDQIFKSMGKHLYGRNSTD